MRKLNFKELIIFENEHYLAINKPFGISTLEDRNDDEHILSMVNKLFPDVQVCHRLDKETSGVLILAKNPESYKHLSIQFQERKVAKVYHAVVHGQTNFNNSEINLPLLVKNKGMVKWDPKNGKKSSTIFRTIQNYKHCSLVECKPVTGRRHQIRVHLKYNEHPIVADTKYGGEYLYLSQIKRRYKHGNREERPLINRVALHASFISFKNVDGKSIRVEAPYPKDFEVLIKQLEKYGL